MLPRCRLSYTRNNNLSNSHKTVRTTTDITTGTNILKLDPGIYSYEDNNASDEQKLAMGFPQPMWHSEITVTGSWADNNKSTGYINIVVRDCSGDTPHIYENLYSWNKWRGWQSYALKSETLTFRGTFAGNLNDAASWKIPAGIYQIKGKDTISNGPDGAQWCLFIQFPDDYHNQVMCIGGDNGVVTRRYIGSPQVWTSWT